MSYDHIRIAVVSPTSGPKQDGLLKGRITPSDFTAAVSSAKTVAIQKVMREDITGTGSTMVDVTAAALDSTTGDFAPFDTTAKMSLNDAFYFYVTDGLECDNLYVQIATPGTGTYTIGLQEWDTVAESWVDVSDLVDGSNNFRASAGLYTISWVHVKKGQRKLHDLDTAKHVWHRLYVKTFTPGATAPILTRIWASATTEIATVYTTQVNSGDWTGASAEIFPLVGAYFLEVHPGPPLGMDVNVLQNVAGTYSTSREYKASDGVWKAIPDIVDPSNDYRNLGTHKIRWTRPADWTSTEHTVGGVTYTGWLSRRRISSVTTMGPTTRHRIQADSYALGSANCQGVELAAGTYNYVTFDSRENTATVATPLQWINGDTGGVATSSIPVGAEDSLNMVDGKLALSAPLVFAAGQSLLVRCNSGGSVIDAAFRLHA